MAISIPDLPAGGADASGAVFENYADQFARCIIERANLRAENARLQAAQCRWSRTPEDCAAAYQRLQVALDAATERADKAEVEKTVLSADRDLWKDRAYLWADRERDVANERVRALEEVAAAAFEVWWDGQLPSRWWEDIKVKTNHDRALKWALKAAGYSVRLRFITTGLAESAAGRTSVPTREEMRRELQQTDWEQRP